MNENKNSKHSKQVTVTAATWAVDKFNKRVKALNDRPDELKIYKSDLITKFMIEYVKQTEGLVQK